MDDLLKARLQKIDERLDALAETTDRTGRDLVSHRHEVIGQFQEMRKDMTDAFRDMNLRLSTEIHTVLGALTDIKNFLVDRDTTKQRLEAMEKRLAQLER